MKKTTLLATPLIALALVLTGCSGTDTTTITTDGVSAGDWQCDAYRTGEPGNTLTTPYEREDAECVMFEDEEDSLFVVPGVTAGDWEDSQR